MESDGSSWLVVAGGEDPEESSGRRQVPTTSTLTVLDERVQELVETVNDNFRSYLTESGGLEVGDVCSILARHYEL